MDKSIYDSGFFNIKDMPEEDRLRFREIVSGLKKLFATQMLSQMASPDDTHRALAIGYAALCEFVSSSLVMIFKIHSKNDVAYDDAIATGIENFIQTIIPSVNKRSYHDLNPANEGHFNEQ